MLKGVIIGSILAAALAAASPVSSSAVSSSATPHAQQVHMTFLRGDRVLYGNIALAPGVPVRVTVTNYTREFHTFTAPGLHVNTIVFPAYQNAPRRTTFTFTPREWGSFAWHCVICPSGIHRNHHAMGGILYMIVSPSALP